MSGRKNKHKHRGQQRKQPSELLDDLNSLHELLITDEDDEIPVLNQVASQGEPEEPPISPTAEPSTAPTSDTTEDTQALEDEVDLPILFSPVEEEMLAQQSMSLAESDLALLRPLQELAVESDEPADTYDTEQTQAAPKSEQSEVPANSPQASKSEPLPATANLPTTADRAEPEARVENPFLPDHIRSRLTGGRLPKRQSAETLSRSHATSEAIEKTTASNTRTKALVMAQAMAEKDGSSAEAEPSVKERQRHDLIEQLVAQQLPDLERQLRAQIEKVVDELGVWD
ncbi:hypothetical protein MO867_05185 [Microbulbifer sp. OS29]|uniref:Uncharacterized protein n=1 Tax=Microbulbifer okhotskensis TaxID=2926617 RepID=A0A9X2EL87_9GAMM|nr:hypothetical protein [Microbulbifer okhotskensis]MCO1333731.1 hypothetical protein [Microbulbifer okhotskensis]